MQLTGRRLTTKCSFDARATSVRIPYLVGASKIPPNLHEISSRPTYTGEVGRRMGALSRAYT